MIMCDIAGCGKPATIKCEWTVTIPQSGSFCDACNRELWDRLKELVVSQKCSYYVLSPICEKVEP